MARVSRDDYSSRISPAFQSATIPKGILRVRAIASGTRNEKRRERLMFPRQLAFARHFCSRGRIIAKNPTSRCPTFAISANGKSRSKAPLRPPLEKKQHSDQLASYALLTPSRREWGSLIASDDFSGELTERVPASPEG